MVLIENAQVVFPGEKIERGGVLLDQGRIQAINPKPDAIPADAQRVDGGGRLLTPGLIDIHTHGVRTHQYQASPDEIIGGSQVLPEYGTTCFLPTLVPQKGPKLPDELGALASALERTQGARAGGLHVEGPFMAYAGAACDTQPGDVALLEEIIAACKSRMRIMSLSPETANIIPVIERLCEHNITVSLTHTAAAVEQTQAAIDAGARHATHFYDTFLPPNGTDIGVHPTGAIETILADPRMTVDFICDGVHVHPMAIKVALAAKDWQGVALITDSNIGAGMPPGRYPTPWGYPVVIGLKGGARIDDPKHPHYGVLAGSALTMDAGMANLLRWLDRPREQIWAMGTRTPGRIAGLRGLGVIEAGAQADLVLWDDDLKPSKTWVAGKLVYERRA